VFKGWYKGRSGTTVKHTVRGLEANDGLSLASLPCLGWPWMQAPLTFSASTAEWKCTYA